MNRNDIDPIEKIVAEFSFSEKLFHILVGCAHKPHIYLYGALVSDTFYFTFLENTKQLYLHGERHVSYFIEEKAAMLRRFKRPFRSRRAPVKAPFTWPRSSLSSRNSLSAAQLTVMNGPVCRLLRRWIAFCHHILAGSAFTVMTMEPHWLRRCVSARTGVAWEAGANDPMKPYSHQFIFELLDLAILEDIKSDIRHNLDSADDLAGPFFRSTAFLSRWISLPSLRS